MSERVPSLESMVGGEIYALVPIFSSTIFQRFTLHAVESAGIWVENQKVINDFLAQSGVTASPKSVIWFLPWQQIVTIAGAIDVPGLSERGLGL
jgi:hypothetical protein